MISATRYHDISAGHRVFGHEGKCRYLHGHNYRIHFHCRSNELDPLGRVLDFGLIKTLLCQWLEENWDHKFLIWENDLELDELPYIGDGVVRVPFNPTAELMAKYLVEVVGPKQLAGTCVELYRVDVEETRKCSATFQKVNK